MKSQMLCDLVWIRRTGFTTYFHVSRKMLGLKPHASLSLNIACCEPYSMRRVSFFSDNHSRVVLNVLNNDPATDYINACYVDVSCSAVPWMYTSSCIAIQLKTEKSCFVFIIVRVTKRKRRSLQVKVRSVVVCELFLLTYR